MTKSVFRDILTRSSQKQGAKYKNSLCKKNLTHHPETLHKPIIKEYVFIVNLFRVDHRATDNGIYFRFSLISRQLLLKIN